MEGEKEKEFLENELLKLELNIKRQRGTGINSLELCQRKLGILLKLKEYERLVSAGYYFIGSDGPDLIVQKFILTALCYNGNYQECLDVLKKWGMNYPNELEKLTSIKHVLEPLIQRVCSNSSLSASLFQNIEHILGLPNFEPETHKKMGECGSWKCRSPPTQTKTYYLCPRISNLAPCLFGDNCLAAHSKEELEEWKARSKNELSRRSSEVEIEAASRTPWSESQQEQSQRVFRIRSNESRGPRLGSSFTPYGNWLPEPPHNTPYLNQLIKDYCDHSSLADFWPNVDGVKLTWSGPLQVNTASLAHVWTVLIQSQRRDTLRTVSLLHDMDRINFRISKAYFCEDSTFSQGIDLMKSNICNHKNALKLQVLSTFIPPKCLNRPWYYYQMKFTFRAIGPGDFAQTVVFDFKEKPKLIQHLTVHITKDGGQTLLDIPQGRVANATSTTLPQPESNTQLFFHRPYYEIENKIEKSFPERFEKKIWNDFEGCEKVPPLPLTNHHIQSVGSMFNAVPFDPTMMPNVYNVLIQRPFSTISPSSVRFNENMNVSLSTTATEKLLPAEQDSVLRTRLHYQAPVLVQSYISGPGHTSLRRSTEHSGIPNRSSGSNLGTGNDSSVSFDEATERRRYVAPISRPKLLLMPPTLKVVNSSCDPFTSKSQPLCNHVNCDVDPSAKRLLPTPPPHYFPPRDAYSQDIDQHLHRNIFYDPFSNSLNRNVRSSQSHPYHELPLRHLETDHHVRCPTIPVSNVSHPQHITYVNSIQEHQRHLQTDSLRSRVTTVQNLPNALINSHQPFEGNELSSLYHGGGRREKNQMNEEGNNWPKYPKSISTLKDGDNGIHCFEQFIDQIAKNLILKSAPSSHNNGQLQSNLQEKVIENEVRQKENSKLNSNKKQSGQIEQDQLRWLNSSDFPPITRTLEPSHQTNSDWVKVSNRRGGNRKKHGPEQGVSSSSASTHVNNTTTTSLRSSQLSTSVSSSVSPNGSVVMEHILNSDYLNELCYMRFPKDEACPSCPENEKRVYRN